MNLLRWTTSAALAAAFLFPAGSSAQEATQVPAGGIISLQRAPLSIAKELISISPDHVSAEYTFRNDTPAEITSTMAFLVPNYTLNFQRDELRRQGFSDAEFQIDGQVTSFAVEIHALLHGQDVTAPLVQAGIDIASFGHYAQGSPDMRHLSHKQFRDLVDRGLYALSTKTDSNPTPKWTVSKRYVHDQTFSPGLPVKMEISYTPTAGVIDSIFAQPQGSRPQGSDDPTPPALDTIGPDTEQELRSICTNPALEDILKKWMTSPQRNVGLSYVDFFLTGNLAWKTPVQDFTLEINIPAAAPGGQNVPTFCWDGGPIQQTSGTLWTARASNYVPSRDLRIGWFMMENQTF
jgi:hypothetical protein